MRQYLKVLQLWKFMEVERVDPILWGVETYVPLAAYTRHSGDKYSALSGRSSGGAQGGLPPPPTLGKKKKK